MGISSNIETEIRLAVEGHKGITKVQMRGRNAAVTTSPETIWGPSSAYARLSAGAAMEVVSASANDTSAGTGARTVRVTGVLGTTYLPFSEDIILAGATPVPLVNTTAIAINSLRVLTAGSGGTNAGKVDVRVVSGGAIKRQLFDTAFGGLGVDADFLYTIPAGYVGVLRSVEYGSYGMTGSFSAFVQTTDVNGVIRSEGFYANSLANFGQGRINFGAGLVIPEKTLVELRGAVSTGVGDVYAMADLFLINLANSEWGNN